jgi:hypothetical protein
VLHKYLFILTVRHYTLFRIITQQKSTIIIGHKVKKMKATKAVLAVIICASLTSCCYYPYSAPYTYAPAAVYYDSVTPRPYVGYGGYYGGYGYGYAPAAIGLGINLNYNYTKHSGGSYPHATPYRKY